MVNSSLALKIGFITFLMFIIATGGVVFIVDSNDNADNINNTDRDNNNTNNINNTDRDNKSTMNTEKFIITVDSYSGSNSETEAGKFKIETNENNYKYNYNINWVNTADNSDRGSANNITGDYIIDFANKNAKYRVSIEGQFPHMMYSGSIQNTDAHQIRTVENWGNNNWKNMSMMFQYSGVEINATDTPDLSNVSDMSLMFSLSTFNSSINDWNTSNIKNMNRMFNGARNFNMSLDSWDVSNVSRMNNIFAGANEFDQNISSWCVEKINSKPFAFDDRSEFEGQPSKQPKWGKSC